MTSSELFYEMETELLKNLVRYLSKGSVGSAQWQLDKLHEMVLNCASISMVHLSRMAEDLIIYNSGESAFIELSDMVTSGSSLMPQKKNPDALELIRGKTGRVFGSHMGMLVTLKALPLAYNKDMQEDKEGLFDALDTWHDCLDMASLVFDGIKVKKDRVLAAAKGVFRDFRKGLLVQFN